MKSNTEYSCGRVQGAMAKAEYKVYSMCRCILMNIQKCLKHKITKYVFSQFVEYRIFLLQLRWTAGGENELNLYLGKCLLMADLLRHVSSSLKLIIQRSLFT